MPHKDLEARKAYMAAYRKNNRERLSALQQRWTAENQEYRKEWGRLHRAKNKEKIAEEKRRYAKENAEKVAAYQKKWKADHAEKMRVYRMSEHGKKLHQVRTKRAYATNAESIRRKRKAYLDSRPDLRARLADKERQRSKLKRFEISRRIMNRLATDPEYKLRTTLRKRISRALHYFGAPKSDRTAKLVGCSMAHLRAHLEAQFKPGMTWKNHGLRGWHVDHIRPCASFNLLDPEQQLKCFSWTNLQPLWWWENISKADSLPESPASIPFRDVPEARNACSVRPPQRE